jgi:Fe-S-cluster containining protein
MHINQTIASVLEIFGAIDGQVAAFQLATGLHCPKGCGLCCRSDTVCTTIVEMLPAAAEILRRKEENRRLACIARSGDAGVCVFYAQHPADCSGGHCGMYQWRPSVCRLFGFAAIENKHGRPELAACKHLKQIDPARIARAREAGRSGLKIPLFTGYSIRLAGLAPSMGAELMPVNPALRSAIEHLGLKFRLQGPGGHVATKRKHAA